MVGCILAGNIEQDNGYNEWLDSVMPSFNEQQHEEAEALREYFGKTSPKVYRYMRADKDLHLSFFISAVEGCGKSCLRRLWRWENSLRGANAIVVEDIGKVLIFNGVIVLVAIVRSLHCAAELTHENKSAIHKSKVYLHSQMPIPIPRIRHETLANQWV